MRSNRWWAAPILAGGVAVLAACGTSSPATSGSGSTTTHSPPASTAGAGTTSSSVQIGTKSTKLGTVLVDSQGHTLYWFAIDTPTASKCTGSCSHYWPPVIGKPTAMSGTSLPKAFGTITRSGGQTQATYDGHPLYTYVADSAPGQTGGNGLNLSGGKWWAMTPTGAIVHGTAAAPSPSKSSKGSGGGGGGYGY